MFNTQSSQDFMDYLDIVIGMGFVKNDIKYNREHLTLLEHSVSCTDDEYKSLCEFKNTVLDRLKNTSLNQEQYKNARISRAITEFLREVYKDYDLYGGMIMENDFLYKEKYFGVIRSLDGVA